MKPAAELIMTLSGAICGNVTTNIAGMMAKYFATSFAMLKVVSAPRVIRSCFPISTTSISFVGFESRSTMAMVYCFQSCSFFGSTAISL